ncbi:hypothetical protein QSJ18_18350 [Gordonia sp. ABSL1-1]|uniref:hypothetical protein n=1 Tax=Gordonia sp. ABSL1-1 TaxID=3053923 RepID=UPI002573EA7F|nr:hypothetical protein [Gordonia sp. ABSL1-1]MDL9938712.1 hypothetical protein [Gordonia sp. ABSL1-1]
MSAAIVRYEDIDARGRAYPAALGGELLADPPDALLPRQFVHVLTDEGLTSIPITNVIRIDHVNRKGNQ